MRLREEQATCMHGAGAIDGAGRRGRPPPKTVREEQGTGAYTDVCLVGVRSEGLNDVILH